MIVLSTLLTAIVKTDGSGYRALLTPAQTILRLTTVVPTALTCLTIGIKKTFVALPTLTIAARRRLRTIPIRRAAPPCITAKSVSTLFAGITVVRGQALDAALACTVRRLPRTTFTAAVTN